MLLGGGHPVDLAGRQVPTGVMLILLTVLNAYLGLSQEGKAAAPWRRSRR